MTDLLSIGASGVRANQAALTTVSENIANAGVAGYSRRTLATKEVASTAATAMHGYGVQIAGVTRASDLYKAAAVRSAGTDLARTEAGGVWLDRIQSALTGADLGDRLTSFFTSAKSVAADPSATAPRAVMLEQAQSVAGAFGATGDALAQVTADLDATGDQAARDLNSLSAALAKINDGLGRATKGTAGAANLADQRDSILEQMSALVDVNATFDAAGRATVRAGAASGPVLVSGSDVSTVSYARGADGAVAFSVQRGDEASLLAPQGGALAGVADGAQRVADARTALNDLAGDFVDGVNTVQAQGRDLKAPPGAAMFAVGEAPTDISVSLTDPGGIAAAAVGGGTRDNSNLARLETLRSASDVEGRVTTLVSANAAAIASRKTVAEAQGAIRDSAVTARDAVSGVDLDTEAVDLLRFQQAYQASSRIIQVARETLQSLLSIN